MLKALIFGLVVVPSLVWLARAAWIPIAVLEIYLNGFSVARVIETRSNTELDRIVHNELDVPRIIHRTLKSLHSMRTDWKAPNRTCYRQHSGWSFMVWTEDISRYFMQQHYPFLLPTFDSYAYDIQRADVIRYAALHHFGGVYIDMNIRCRRRLDFLRSFAVVLPETTPLGFSNDVLVSAPGHPFFDFVLHQLPAWNHFYFSPYPTVLLSSGPLFLSWCFARFQAMQGGAANQLYVLPADLYSNLKSRSCLFGHLAAGGSWQGWDVVIFKLYALPICATLVCVVLGFTMFFWRQNTANCSKR